MRQRTPTYAYAVVLIVGIPAMTVADALQPPEASVLLRASIAGAVYAILGSVTGFVWPLPSWRWGLWMAAPVLVLVGLSVAFAGYVGIFLSKDLPLLVAVVFGGSLGAVLGGRLRTWRQIPNDSADGSAT